MRHNKTYYKPGAWNVICDRTGQKIKSTEGRKEWNGLIVRGQSWEERHPQDLLRGVPDHQAVPDPRNEAADSFTDLTENASSALLDGGSLKDPEGTNDLPEDLQ